MNPYRPGECHGSHPEHGASFFPIANLQEGQVCSICHATAFRAEAAWHGCQAAQCDFVLCHKCFDVEETLLPVTQVVMRKPTLAYTDPPCRPIAVHTRPKMNSFQLAPIYPGTLIEVVSRAISKEDGAVYFRLQNGGWICSSNVVMLTTTTDDASNIAKLTRVHLAGAYDSIQQKLPGADEIEPVVPARIRQEDLVACMRESMQLIDENLPYGMVMSSLLMYPLLTAPLNTQTADGAENEEDSNSIGPRQGRGSTSVQRADEGAANSSSSSSSTRVFSREPVQTTLQFVHFVLHAALDDIAHREEAQEALDQGTILSFYGDVIGGCLLTLQRLSEEGGVVLPEAFVALVLRALGYFVMVTSTLLRRVQPGDDDGPHVLRLYQHAVQRDNVEQSKEHHSVYHIARFMTALCSQLTRSSLHRYPVWLRQLLPLRHQLIYVKDEVVERTFCDLVTHSLVSPCSAATSQRQFFQVDPLEIAARLLKKATLAVSQLSALQMISAGAHKDTRNIETIAGTMMHNIMEPLVKPHSPSVVVAVLDCLGELAFNDPRRESATSFETPKRVLTRGGEQLVHGSEMTLSSSHNMCTCSQALHSGCAPFQPMHVFCLSNGAKVALCSECASQHPPAHVEAICEPECAHFQCQCVLCARRQAPHQLPPPSVPATSAITLMQDGELWIHVLRRVRLDAEDVSVLSSVGRLALRLAAPVNVVESLAGALVHKSSLASCADAALAVAVNRHMQPVQELLAKSHGSLLARFISAPYTAVTDASGFGSRATSVRKPFSGTDYITPSQSHVKSELGLSPSPSVLGSTGISSSVLTERQRNSSAYLAHPSVNLFPVNSAVGFGSGI